MKSILIYLANKNHKCLPLAVKKSTQIINYHYKFFYQQFHTFVSKGIGDIRVH